MPAKNIFYAQSGGPTAVINATACGLIQTAQQHKNLGKVFAGKNGIIGALKEELIDTSLEPATNIEQLRHTPGSGFGSCRFKLKDINEDDSQYRRLIDVFNAHGIGYFFYNGGGDSQDTAYKISQLSQTLNYPLTCIGIPKTIDNDLPFTDCCPGFGSVAKYIATSIHEAALDVRGMAASSTKIFILEVMGRHAGWIASAAGLVQQTAADAPHLILFPEITFNQQAFLNKVHETVSNHGYCVIVASEGIKQADGTFVSESGSIDAFGHHQLGGVAPRLAQFIRDQLGYKYHWALADYLQRSARHIASQTDFDHAYALGEAAINAALSGKNNVMLTIERLSNTPYQWRIGSAPLKEVANSEKEMPREFIDAEGFGITQACRDYLLPLIQGEAFPPFKNGLPQYVTLNNTLTAKKLSGVYENT